MIVENKNFESVDDPLNAHRAEGYETTLVPEIPRIIEDDNVVMNGTSRLSFKHFYAAGKR